MEIELEGVCAGFNLLEQLGLGVVARREGFFGDLNFFVLAVEAFLLALADDLLSVELELIASRWKRGLKGAVGDDGAVAGEIAALFDENNRAIGNGAAVERDGAGDGGFSIRAAGSDKASKDEGL